MTCLHFCSNSDSAGVDCCDQAGSAVGIIHIGHIENDGTHCVPVVY